MSGRMRVVAPVLALVAVLGGYWFMLIAPKRAETATVSGQTAKAKGRLEAAVSAAGSSEQARAAYQRDYATIARLGKAVPADDDVASLVYQLEAVTRANKIDFRAVKLGSRAEPPAAPATPPPADGGKDAPASGKDEAAAPAGTPAAPAVPQADPGAVVGTAGLVTLPFTLTFEGGYLAMQRLLGAIDRLAQVSDGAISVRGRLLTVDGFTLGVGTSGFPKVKAQVAATAYVVPPSEGVTGGASPEGPAAAGSAGAPATATPPVPGSGG